MVCIPRLLLNTIDVNKFYLILFSLHREYTYGGENY